MTIRTLTLAAVLLGAAATQSSIESVRVRKGDTLYGIAKRAGVTPRSLMEANRLPDNGTIHPGTVLQIPRPSTQGAAAQPMAAAPAKPAQYTVRKGDTVGRVAKIHGLTRQQLRAMNPQLSWPRLKVGEKVTVGLPVQKGQVAATEAVLRAGPSAGSKALATLGKGETVTLLKEQDGWLKVKAAAGLGFIPEAAVTGRRAEVVAPPKPAAVAAKAKPAARAKSAPRVAANGVTSDQLLSKAFAYKGVRYRWGGTSRSGVDCSGFTSSVFRSIGVTLPRTSIEQAKVGARVSRQELTPGDLVFFRTGRGARINHVGIYLGEGKFIHASSGGGRVQVSSLGDGYYNRRFVTARRVRSFAKSSGAKGALVKAAPPKDAALSAAQR